MKLHIFRWMLYGWLVFALIGCGGVSEQDDVSGVLEITLLPTSLIDGDCTNPSELENWIQTLVFNQAEFTNFLQNARGQSRAQLYRLIQDLNMVALTVASTPILPCGETAYQLTISAMQNTLDTMGAYVNAERQDLDTIITSAQAQFAASQIEQELLIRFLEDLYQSNPNVP